MSEEIAEAEGKLGETTQRSANIKATGKDDSLVEYKEAEAFTTKIKTVDFSKAIRDLNHNPVVDPEEGIRRTTEWMRYFYRL